MGIKDITAGTKKAKPIAARFIETDKGTPGIEVAFEFDNERLTWVGWMTEKAQERSVKILVEVLGWNGSEAVDAEGVFTDPKAFSFGKDVEVVVELETYEGKTYPKIKWVNNLGGGSQFSGAAPTKIKSLGLKALFLAAKGIKKEVPF